MHIGELAILEIGTYSLDAYLIEWAFRHRARVQLR